MKTLVSWTRLILIGYGIWLAFIAIWIYLTQKPPYHFPFGDVVILLVGIIISIFIGSLMLKVDERTIYSRADAYSNEEKSMGAS